MRRRFLQRRVIRTPWWRAGIGLGRVWRRSAMALLAVGVLLALCGGTAQAGYVHPYLSSFGSFYEVQGVATDSATGDVYVLAAGWVSRWDANGNPVEYGSTGSNTVYGGSFGNDEGELAIDNSSGPAKGDLYVAHGSGEIWIYDDATGERLGELTGQGAPGAEACGVAVDPSGNVYVGLYPDHIDKFVPTGNPVTNADYASSIGGVNGVCNVGADSLGNAYAITWSTGPVTRYEAGQFGSLSPIGSIVDSSGSTMAVDPVSGDVYVDQQSKVSQFGAGGEPFEQPIAVFAASGPGAISESFGISINGFNNDVYVSNGQGRISVFGPAIELEPPAVTTEAPSSVTGTKATLHGTVNPQGTSSYSETTWRFEYTTDGFSWKSTPGGTIAPGESPVSVSDQISGLPPSHEISYRLTAVNTAGKVQSAVQSFTTPASAPEVSIEPAAEPVVHEATLHGSVNPAGQATTYMFEYGTTTSYGNSVPVDGASAGSGVASVTVVESATGLEPATAYHYRLTAVNATGVTHSPDASFITYPAVTAPGDCPNEARRKEQHATFLPDCRAYEMVSPVDKKGSDVAGGRNTSLLSVTGDRANFFALAGFGENHGSGGLGYTQYAAIREAGAGWTSHGITPTPKGDDFQLLLGSTDVSQFSENFERALLSAYDLAQPTDDIQGGLNEYVENTDTVSLETVTSISHVEPFTGGKFAFAYSHPVGSSGDLGVVTFEGEADLLPSLPSGEKRYEWNHGKLEVAGILPDGSYPSGGSAGVSMEGFFEHSEIYHQISRDGSHVLFKAPAWGNSQLYMRRDSSNTVWISQPESSTPNPEPRNVEYLDMTPDGKKVLFASSDPLTDADPGGEGYGMYVYTDSPHPESEQNLTFLTRIVINGNHYGDGPSAFYEGASEDAKRIYFYTDPTPSLQQEGTYVWDEGTIRLVAAMHNPLGKEYEPDIYWHSLAEPAADGRTFAFLSPEQLTDAPVGQEPNGSGKPAMYVYDEQTGDLRCVSCLRSGPTTSSAEVLPEANETGVLVPQRPRFLSGNGRYVFFSTADALVPNDVNKAFDAYEYDTQTGTTSLLSWGTGEGSWFADASPDGSNVLIVSRQPYLAKDKDLLVDLYDVRIGGGFVEPPPSTGGCVGDECQGIPAAAPSFSTASGFSGLGNVVQPASVTRRSRTLTRKQKLARALKACKRKKGRARRQCVSRARKRYGARKASNMTTRAARS